MSPRVSRFLDAKVRGLEARALRLGRLGPDTVGLRAQDRPYAPSPAHFRAANARLARLDREVRSRLQALRALHDTGRASPDAILARASTVEAQVDRVRRAYALFFEVFSQRGTQFAAPLAACDAVAADCFTAVREGLPGLLGDPLLKPLTYLDPGISPATFRRGVMLRRLMGEPNPFPLVRIPYERLESPWGMGVLLHEVAHNLHADLGVWNVTRAVLTRRVYAETQDAWLARVWGRWHKEIFADLLALLLGGPASAGSMKDFLAYPAPRVLGFRPLAVHPVPYLRGLLLAEMIRRMGFAAEAEEANGAWRRLYDRHLAASRMPRRLLDSAPLLIRAAVDELAFRPMRALADHAASDVIRFTAEDQRRIRQAVPLLVRGRVPDDLPPRHLVSASRYAFDLGRADPAALSSTILTHLASRASHPPAALAA